MEFPELDRNVKSFDFQTEILAGLLTKKVIYVNSFFQDRGWGKGVLEWGRMHQGKIITINSFSISFWSQKHNAVFLLLFIFVSWKIVSVKILQILVHYTQIIPITDLDYGQDPDYGSG